MHARQQLRRGFLLVAQKRDPVNVAVRLQRLSYPSHPSVWTTLPDSTDSSTNDTRLRAEASGIRRIRILPIPLPSSSAATTINALLSVPRPRLPSSRPPR